MLELEEALARILAALPAPVCDCIALRGAHGRALVESISAQIDLPPFDNSAMDGFAVRADEVAFATPEAPVRLQVRGKIAAGENFQGELASGECARLFTGSPLPCGADAVVMQEDTRPDATRPGEILVLAAVKARENVRFRGGDVKQGATLAQAGDVLTPAKMSLLAAAGVIEVNVGKCPVIGLLATGSELREAGQPLAPGQIYDSNRIGLAALLQRAGAVPKVFPLVPDTLAATQRALEQAFSESDAVVTCGGASVGEMDFVKAAFETLGGELQFWKVAIRPGKPFVFGNWHGKFLFGLPGNPVSALVTFLLLVRPALLRWQGAREVALPSSPGVLAEPLANIGQRRHFTRVRVDIAGRIFSAGLQTSHALGSLAVANGLVDVPPQATLAAGTTVRVMRWD
jgi:molybdopterin molybdotransferase